MSESVAIPSDLHIAASPRRVAAASSVSIHEILEIAIKAKASDLVIKAGASPVVRVDGRLQPTSYPPISPEATRELAVEIIFSAGRDVLLNYPSCEGAGIEMEDADARMRD